MVKGLAPKLLDPSRYHLNPRTDPIELEKGMPWRITDEFGKFKRIDHEGRTYQGRPYSVEPDVAAKHILVASMMHTSMRSPTLSDTPDVTCPSDFPDSERRKQVVHHEQIPDQPMSKQKKNAPDKKFSFTIKAKSIPVTPKTVASSQGVMRERWLVSIYKEIENFLQNMAIKDADPSLVVKWKSLGKWPLPCQMVFALKPLTQAQLTQAQQTGEDVQEDYKHNNRLVICGNFAAWGEHSTTTTNLDAPLLLSLACSADTTWSSIDITRAFLNTDIHDDDTVLVTLPPILVKMDIVKPQTVWQVRKAIYGLREAPHLWQKERDQKLRDLEFKYNDKLAYLVQSHIHPSVWFIAEGPLAEHQWIPPFDHSLRSDEWTARLHDHHILGYMGVYVADLLIAGPRSLHDSLIIAVQGVWKTSQPEHLGPEADCVPVLRFPGMNL